MFNSFFKNNIKLSLIIYSIIHTFLLFNYNCFFKNISIIYDYYTISSYCFFIENKTVKIYFLMMMLVFTLLIFFLNKNIFKNNSKTIQLCYFIIIVSSVLLTITESILVFLISYELVLVPSAFLVFFYSPNRRTYIVTMYFLLWTQLGSFLVLISSSYYYYNFSIYYFYQINYYFNLKKSLIPIFILLGFFIKIPTWPFHFWLTKTHVEASTGFSIFLSGILVKTALVGLLKFSFLVEYYTNFILFLIMVSILDTTLKIYFQVDFKKLAAFLTIQEMSLLVLFGIFSISKNSLLFFKFILLHTILSCSLFFFSEIIYSRSGTRLISKTTGLINDKPMISVMFYIIIVLFIGLPFSLKFFIEIVLMFKFISYNIVVFIQFLFFVQLLTILFFFKNTILILFSYSNNRILDSNKIEFIIFLLISLPMVSIALY